jgi:hypothetical protein
VWRSNPIAANILTGILLYVQNALTAERNALTATVKKLNRDVAKVRLSIWNLMGLTGSASFLDPCKESRLQQKWGLDLPSSDGRLGGGQASLGIGS